MKLGGTGAEEICVHIQAAGHQCSLRKSPTG
jgi:hypothetical protein